MADVFGKVDVFPNHFEPSKEAEDCSTNKNTDYTFRSRSHTWAVRRVMGAASMLNLFTLPRFPWGSNKDDDKVELTRAEVESLRSEIVDAEEREMNLKAQLEHIDGILRSTRLSGYLYIRTRWTQLPGEPPIIDDADVDDWLPRFVVFQGPSIFYYLRSTDLSPQDSTLLSDVVEVGTLPSFTKDDGELRYAFFFLTSQGLRFECSATSKMQIQSWVAALRNDCKLQSDSAEQ